MIKLNEYFSGNVKSLGYETAEGKATVGVMAPGDYEFTTGSAEIMTVIEGSLVVLLPGKKDWETYSKGQSFSVQGNSSFQLKVAATTSYLCQFR